MPKDIVVWTKLYGYLRPSNKDANVRVLVSLAATYHWPLHQLDIKNAFLNGILDEKVYMEQPPGFVAQGECAKKVYRLKKSLYGLNSFRESDLSILHQ